MADAVSDKVMYALGRLASAVEDMAIAIDALLEDRHGHDEHEAGQQPGPEGPLPAASADRASGPAFDGTIHAAASLCVPLNVSSKFGSPISGDGSHFDFSDGSSFLEKSKGPLSEEVGPGVSVTVDVDGGGAPLDRETVLAAQIEALGRARAALMFKRAAEVVGEGENSGLVAGRSELEILRRMGPIEDGAERAGKEAYSGYRLPDLPGDQDGLPDLPKGDAGVVPKVDRFEDWYAPGKPWWRKW